MIEVPNFVEELVGAGINVTISQNNDGIYFDLNLQAKSHMHLYQRGDQWYVGMRYNEEFVVDDIEDLKRYAEHGKHGRDFINPAWAEFLMSDAERAQRDLARGALARMTETELQAVKEYLKS